jgi:hypothetical protein
MDKIRISRVHFVRDDQRSAAHSNRTVRPVVVVEVRIEDVRRVADFAQVAGVVLSRAVVPDPSRIVDVHLARRVVEAKEPAGEDRNRVLLVVDVRQPHFGCSRIDKIGESLVANLDKLNKS